MRPENLALRTVTYGLKPKSKITFPKFTKSKNSNSTLNLQSKNLKLLLLVVSFVQHIDQNLQLDKYTCNIRINGLLLKMFLTMTMQLQFTILGDVRNFQITVFAKVLIQTFAKDINLYKVTIAKFKS